MMTDFCNPGGAMLGSEPTDQAIDNGSPASSAGRAAAALDRLARDAGLHGDVDRGSTQDTHAAFAQLYFHSTRRWLDHLEDQADAHIGYMVIERFYDLYDLYVRQVIDGRSTQTAAHWIPYFRLSDSLGDRQTAAGHWRLLFLGARAHVRYDLAEAVYFTYRDYSGIHGRSPSRDRFRHLLLGPKTDAVFLSAARDFVSSRQPTRHGVGAHGNHMVHLGTDWLRRFWVPAFQHWRRAAWADALSRIDARRQREGPANARSAQFEGGDAEYG
jgi:hypothetical protein